MLTSRQDTMSVGYHCERFDTRLLQQVISIDLDRAIRRLEQETGIMIDHATRATWERTILGELKKEIFDDIASHTFLPGALHVRLKDCIEALIRAEVLPAADSPCPSAPPAERRTWAELLADLLRCLFEKRLE